MNVSLSLFVSNYCLTFLSSACTSSTSNQVYSLVRIYHRAISWRFHKCLSFALLELMYRGFQASTLHGVGPLLSHVVIISPVPLCIHLIWLSKTMSSPITPRINSVWKFLPWWPMTSLPLEFEKVLFHSEHPLKLLDQEHRVRKCNTSRVMKHNLILQDAMSPTHGRKSGMGDWEVFLVQVFRCPSCYAVNAYVIVSCASSFINLRMRFFYGGRAVTSRVIAYLITFITVLIKNQIHRLAQF
jgi:hypothetical protein